jgi:hypothetical protein
MDELDNPIADTKAYSDEEISRILNTAKATRKERDTVAERAKQLETQNLELQGKLEQIKGIDPDKFKQLEQIAATYEERKLEEERKFSELKERWTGERTSFSQQIEDLQKQLQSTQVTNALEKAFYGCGGRGGKDDDGYTYFDLIQERAKAYIQLDDKGKMAVIDPRDGTPMRDPKGNPYSVEDLMLKLRSSGPTAALFEAPDSRGSGMNRSANFNSIAATKDSLMQMGNRAERLSKARELGIK